eukprot:TRINITY_DN3706_c0_g1_i1.p1 TRINITY_DN3706_c0_g1~~TRINITY_DN3706_c0_g1_i1.p1  ORF type:complete len:288 (-),score=66.21 TRINITY_DN3706_c0_g1_i1:25-888(-)
MSFSDWGGNSSGGYQSTNPFGAPQPTPSRGDDKDSEFQNGLQQVTEDIKQMTTNFMTVSNLYKQLGGSQDNNKLRETIQLKIKATESLVKQVQGSIVHIHKLASTSDKRQKTDKLHIDFENFNTKFQQLAAMAREKMDDTPTSVRINIDDTRYADSDFSDDDRSRLLPSQQQQQQFMRLDADRQFQDSLIRQRDADIRDIQGQMIEVNEIFKDLARLVDDQAGVVDNIETNIITAAENVKFAKEEVKNAEEIQTSSRKKLCCFAIFILIMVVVIVLIVVFVTRPKAQ